MYKLILKTILAFVFLFYMATNSFAQPFLKEVNNFKKIDSITPPPSNPILFIGSSSFTKWVDVKNYFPGYTILNRAFGGSSLPDVIYFAEEVIFKYNPKQIVIYCGENDVAGNATAEKVFERFKTLHTLIRTKLPKVSIVFVSLKPSPSREKFWPVMIEANGMIKQFAKTHRKTYFVDIYQSMFNNDGKVMTDIFLSDNLHMNKKGYEIWQPILAPYLKK
jgi:lysophospholipase L1-like esterase